MSIFSIGVTGLNAAQIALATTGNNITNVYTPGYNREVTLLSESGTGNGVSVSGVQRQFNQFVATQLNQAISSNSALSAYEVQINQIDNLLADRDAGLAPLFQNFFSSVQQLVATPSDPAARQGVLGTADTLTAQFRAFDSYLNDMQSGINGQLDNLVVQVNNIAEQIAKLNREIGLAKAKTGSEPNSLLNQRDQLVTELSGYVAVKVVKQDGGSYNISIGNGLPLVAGSSSFRLESMTSASDPTRTVIGYRDTNGALLELPEENFTSGEIGGLMTFRRETLDRAQNQLGQMAVAMTVAFNNQHRLGVDLNGEQGGDFFSVGEPLAFSSSKNSSSPAAYLTASYDPTQLSELKAVDYDVVVTDKNKLTAPVTNPDGSVDAGITITRRDTGAVVEGNYDSTAGTLSFGGMTVSINGAPESGDRFQIQPVRRAAQQLRTEVADIGKIAAGSVTLSPASGTGAANVVSAKLDPANSDKLNIGGAGSVTYKITYNAPAGYSVTDSSDAPILGADGQPIGVKVNPNGGKPILSFGGVEVSLAADLASGESFSVSASTLSSGSGDNRNALQMLELQNTRLVNGSASLSQAYASMVSDVGNRTNIVQVNQDAQEGLVKQLKAVQQGESGVSLDEEGANLLRFQRYYQASAKVIEIGITVIDTLLSMRT